MQRSTLRVNGCQVSQVDVADTRTDRRRGLLSREVIDVPMWFPKTRSVHSIGMRIALDVVHVDRGHRVISVHTMPPGRIGRPRWKAVAILELGEGVASQLGIEPSAKVTVE